jgi:hypothetical protein
VKGCGREEFFSGNGKVLSDIPRSVSVSALESSKAPASSNGATWMFRFSARMSSAPYLEVSSMSIDWMHSLIVVTFMSVWALVGQLSAVRH